MGDGCGSRVPECLVGHSARLRDSFCLRGLGVLLVSVGIGFLSPVLVFGQSESGHSKVLIGPDLMIFGSPAALKLVEEARKVDPLYCPLEQSDRDEAARLYEQAVEAQPGAKSNAPLANRIAQMVCLV